MKKEMTRYSLRYKIKMWWYRLTWEDVKKVWTVGLDVVGSLAALSMIYFLIYILLVLFS